MACLPFETPKLLATGIVSESDIATLLDKRIARYQAMQNAKLIEAKPNPDATNGNAERPPDIETKLPLARTNDRRFRAVLGRLMPTGHVPHGAN